jgi:hypothetical protein
MALPKLEVPTYELKLPVSNKTIKYRPYLVKEQKALMMALESSDAKTIQHNVREILNVCTLSKDVDIDDLPIIDIEYYFIQLRAKSVGEISESKYRCNNEVDEKVCGNVMEAKVNLLEVEPVQTEYVDPEIQLTENITVKMKYPSFSLVKDSIELDDITEVTFNMMANCIEYVYDGEQFHYAKEQTTAELVEFIEQLNQEQFEKMEKFFNSVPKLSKRIEMKCSKCGFQHHLDVEGLESFFG